MLPARALIIAGIALYVWLQSRASAAAYRGGGFVDVQPVGNPLLSDAEFYAQYATPWDMDDREALPADFWEVPDTAPPLPTVWEMDDAAMIANVEPEPIPLPYINPPVVANDNLWAMLATIRYAEGTAGADGYTTLFGYGQIDDLSDHPANMGWPGVKLPDAQCRAAGFGPGCVTTAAGAYQFVRPTWNAIANRLGLPDFSPESQDVAAIELIREKGALPDVLAGRFEFAIGKIRKVWASLPGAGYEQPERSMAALSDVYAQNGGQFAA